MVYISDHLVIIFIKPINFSITDFNIDNMVQEQDMYYDARTGYYMIEELYVFNLVNLIFAAKKLTKTKDRILNNKHHSFQHTKLTEIDMSVKSQISR